VVEGVALEVEASIGISVMAEHAEDAKLLLRRADVALAHAKARGSGIELYAPEQDRFDAEGLKLLGQVRGALEREELVLHYQPQLDLRKGRISGVEALARWRHPQLGLLEPARFIGLVEQTALVGPLALYAIERALRQLVAWDAEGRELRMSVNLSARNLLDEELPRRIVRLLDEQGLGGERLTIEVTESAAMADPERAVRALQALRDAGIGVSIDDFGTGNASIEYLAALPASELKIDKSLITGIATDRRAEAIVRSTIDLARHLELSVVAEGIEERPELERLTALGCDVAQGYLIGRPVPADQLTWASQARATSAAAH
jgi:EAL domain-containing protein (putative c-di-GMP-specific phosphodiesterase class I)